MVTQISQITQKFFSLLQFAIGKSPVDVISIDEKEWEDILKMSIKQSLVGVVFEGIQKLSEKSPDQKPSLTLLCEWIGQTEQIKRQNK